MHPLIESFLERPRGQKIGFWVGSLALIGFLGWQYVIAPESSARDELQGRVDKLQGQVAQETRVARNLQKFRDEVKSLDQQLSVALKELPDKREIPELLQTVSSLARDAGLDVTLFQPQPERLKDFYAEVPVSISVDGTFHQLASFFDDVGQLARIVNISDIVAWNPVTKDTRVVRGLGDAENAVHVRASCVATTFRYLDESERVKVEDPKLAKRRKR